MHRKIVSVPIPLPPNRVPCIPFVRKSSLLRFGVFGTPVLMTAGLALFSPMRYVVLGASLCAMLFPKLLTSFLMRAFKQIAAGEYEEMKLRLNAPDAGLTELERYSGMIWLERQYGKAMLTYPDEDTGQWITQLADVEHKRAQLLEFKRRFMDRDEKPLSPATWEEDEHRIAEQSFLDMHIQPGLAQLVFNPSHKKVYRQCAIYNHPSVSYILKELIDNTLEDRLGRRVFFRSYALRNYRAAQERAGGSIVPYVMGDLTVFSRETGSLSLQEAVVMRKSHSCNLEQSIIEHIRLGQLSSVKEIVKKFFEQDQSLMRRGLYVCDPLLENAVLTPSGEVRFIDAGMFEHDPQASDFYVRGICHYLNNRFFNSLSAYGLTQEQIRDLMLCYGEASGVYISEFNDNVFAFFERSIQYERFYARGEEDYHRYFSEDASPDTWIPVTWDEGDY